MPLKRPHPTRWSWQTAAAWIGFDLRDEMQFRPWRADFPDQIGLSRNEVELRCHAAADDIAEHIANGRLTAYWRYSPDGWELEDRRKHFLKDLDQLSTVLKDGLGGRYDREGIPIDDLEFDRAQVLSIWEMPPPATATVSKAPPPITPLRGGRAYAMRPDPELDSGAALVDLDRPVTARTIPSVKPMKARNVRLGPAPVPPVETGTVSPADHQQGESDARLRRAELEAFTKSSPEARDVLTFDEIAEALSIPLGRLVAEQGEKARAIDLLFTCAARGEFGDDLLYLDTAPICKQVAAILPHGIKVADLPGDIVTGEGFSWRKDWFCLPKAAVAQWLAKRNAAWSNLWGEMPGATAPTASAVTPTAPAPEPGAPPPGPRFRPTDTELLDIIRACFPQGAMPRIPEAETIIRAAVKDAGYAPANATALRDTLDREEFKAMRNSRGRPLS